MTNVPRLIDANQRRWDAMTIKANKIAAFDAVAHKLVAPEAKARYQEIEKATGVPWFIIAVIHQRESSQNFSRQLGQGDPLNQVSTHTPKGRGPFLNHPTDPPLQDAFYRSALDALIDCQPYAARWKDWTPGGGLTLLESYNGYGYANRGVASPYIWAGTDDYVTGKYVADGVYEPNVVDQQLGCAGMLARMKVLDPSINFGKPAIPIPVPEPEPTDPTSPKAPPEGEPPPSELVVTITIDAPAGVRVNVKEV